MPPRTLLLALLCPVLAAASCSDSGDDPAGAAGAAGAAGRGTGGGAGTPGDGGAECPLVATRCPGGCTPIDAWILDGARGCLSRQVRVGCLPPGRAGTGDVACVKEAAGGGLLQLPSGSDASMLAATDEYDACSDAERDQAIAAMPCVYTGADAAGPCPAITTACPTGCVPFEGRRYDRTARCLLPGAQLGCFPEGGNVTRNGGCVEQSATGDVYLLESGSYANQLLFEGHYVACGLDVFGGTTAPADCP